MTEREYEFETRILAARFAVEVDQRLGRATRTYLRELAAMPLRSEVGTGDR